MLGINSNGAVETLRELSVTWRGRFSEQFGAARLLINNDIGKGAICSYDIMPGLSVLAYNIRFNEDMIFDNDESLEKSVHFIYCLEGYCYHKFKGEEGSVKISHMQNTVIKGLENKTNIVRMPGDVDLKFSVITITESRLKKHPSPRSEFLIQTLKEVLEIIDENSPHKHFGAININIAEHAKVLINNSNLNTVGRLIAESSILKTLAAQLKSLQESKDSPCTRSILSEKEIDRILELNTYISKNISSRLTISQLAKESGLSPKKLQSGMQFLYGESLNIFIKNLKLDYAKDLLGNTDKSISEISYEIGIISRSYFSKIFKERFGILPIDLSKKVLRNDVLYKLTYRSYITEETSEDDINNIVESARKNNEKFSITGCLIIYKNIFFQYLEGPKASILDLYDILLKDPRHYDVKLLWKGLTINRLFESWSLAIVSEKDELQAKVDGVLKNINIEKDLSIDDESQTMAGELFWRNVRNRLKTV